MYPRNIAVTISKVKRYNRQYDIPPSDNSRMGTKDVGLRLRHVRELRGFTQVALAKKSGVSQAALSELETGENRSPWGTNLVRIAEALKVSPEWLATGKGQMEGYEAPLPPEAIKVARKWLKLTPEARGQIDGLLDTLVNTSAADKDAVADERVEAAYGRPGSPERRSQSRKSQK